MSYLWKPEEVAKLKLFVNQKKSKEEISKILKRTPEAVEIKVNRLGLQLWRPNRAIKDSEIEELEEDWNDGSISMRQLCKKYGRTKAALIIIAQRNGFGPRPYDDEYISMSDISEYVGISKDSVRTWVRNGLKAKKNHSGKTKYLIDIDDLEKFMKENQHRFNATKVSEYLFSPEPDWLKEKRIRDREFYATSKWVEFTNEDDLRIEHMFKRGKSIKDIAIELKRTEVSISDRIRILGYYTNKWNDYEIVILKENADYMTVQELTKLLPRRTEKGIKGQCEKLKIKYHVSKERCKERP